MAREVVASQVITRAGLVPVLTQPTVDGDAIAVGRVFIMAENTSGTPETVIVETPITVDGLDVEDLVVTVSAGDTALIGPFPTRTFAQPAGANESGGDDQGLAYVDYSVPLSFLRAVITI